MSNLSSRDHVVILEFAKGFNDLYGGDSFRVTRRIRGVLPVSHELKALVVRLLLDAKLYRDFQQALTVQLNTLRGHGSKLVATEPDGSVRSALGYTPGTILMTISQNHGTAHTKITVNQARERWAKTRLFVLNRKGISIVYFEINDIVRPEKA